MGWTGRATVLLAVLTVLVLASGCATEATEDEAVVLARVNGHEISEKRFNLTYVDYLIKTGRNDTPEERSRHLSALVDAYLLADEARRRGLEDALHDEYLETQKKLIVGGRFYEVVLLDTLPEPSEQEVRRAFINSKAEVETRHLLYPTEAEARAAWERLEAGEDFVALANECFETPSFDSMAGYLGPTDFWEVDDVYAETAFSLAAGTHSEPVRSRYGWHIIRVESRHDEPIVIESEFTTRRRGVENRVRQRQRRMAGDSFIRSFMESLDVNVDVEGVTQLRDAIALAMERAEPVDWVAGAEGRLPMPRTTLDANEVAEMQHALSPETLLATYRIDGETRRFTAADYVSWLPHLPRNEVRNRTGASVGRALRNDVLARQGLARGLDGDPVVREAIHYRSVTHLAERLRKQLGTTEAAVPSDDELREGFDRLGFRRLESARADYWIVPFASGQEAIAAQGRIASGELEPDSFEGYERHTKRDVRASSELFAHLRQGPLDEPSVVGTADGAWYLLEIERRNLTFTEFDDVRDQVAAVLAPHLPEMRLRRALLETADVDVNEGLFRSMMDRRRNEAAAPDNI